MTEPGNDRDFIVGRDSPIHGIGAFARRPIARGTRAIAYAIHRSETAALMGVVSRDGRLR
jgi:hypothetical protein